MTDAELQALSAMSMAESVHHQIEAESQKCRGEFVVPYGGPYGYDQATTLLWDELLKRGIVK